jgi:biopolymer transport protein TolR
MGASLGPRKTNLRGRYSNSAHRPMSEINVTPFVDVMLVLLIVFMVAAPLLTAGVQVDLPEAKAKQIMSEDNTPIEITVAKDQKIYIGETEIPNIELTKKLAAMTEGEFDRRIYIRADKILPYGQVMNILGLINGAGYTKVALISEPKS